MELASEQLLALERGDERNAVGGPGRRPAGRALEQRVRVREGRDAGGYELRFAFARHAVPAEVRDPHVRRQPATRSRDDTESRHARRLLTRLTQHLHAETDAEQRRSTRCDITNRSVQGVGATACPSARATALNAASARW